MNGGHYSDGGYLYVYLDGGTANNIVENGGCVRFYDWNASAYYDDEG